MAALSRRQFWIRSGAAIAAARLNAFPLNLPLGFQSYDINAALAQDFDGACRTVAGFGYQLIDYVWLPQVTSKNAKEVRQSFDAAGLGCQNCHFSWADLHENYSQTIEIAHALGLKSLVCQSLSGKSKTLDGWKWQADRLNELGHITKAEDILTGYHNHPTEFKEIDGVIPFDLLIARTDPTLIKFQLDIGSVAVAGKDPIAYLTNYPDRYFSIHVKDVRDGKIGLAVGEGTLDWKKILTAAKALPLQNYAVETGAGADVVMEKLKQSEIYLRDLLL
jgi:sugar phosphate isomerase/epimerase